MNVHLSVQLVMLTAVFLCLREVDSSEESRGAAIKYPPDIHSSAFKNSLAAIAIALLY